MSIHLSTYNLTHNIGHLRFQPLDYFLRALEPEMRGMSAAHEQGVHKENVDATNQAFQQLLAPLVTHRCDIREIDDSMIRVTEHEAWGGKERGPLLVYQYYWFTTSRCGENDGTEEKLKSRKKS